MELAVSTQSTTTAALERIVAHVTKDNQPATTHKRQRGKKHTQKQKCHLQSIHITKISYLVSGLSLIAHAVIHFSAAMYQVRWTNDGIVLFLFFNIDCTFKVSTTKTPIKWKKSILVNNVNIIENKSSILAHYHLTIKWNLSAKRERERGISWKYLIFM